MLFNYHHGRLGLNVEMMAIQTILLLKTARKAITTHQVMWQAIRTAAMTTAPIGDLLHRMFR